MFVVELHQYGFWSSIAHFKSRAQADRFANDPRFFLVGLTRVRQDAEAQ